MNSLTEHIKTESTTSRYINALKENEVFRIASGIKSSLETNNMLMEIYLLGVASNSDLKRLSQYLKPDNGQVEIVVNRFDKLQFTYSFLAASFLILYGVVMGSPYFVMGDGVKSFSGLLVLFIFTLTAAIVGRDYRTFRILKRVKQLLVEHNMVTNPNKSIQWNFTRWFRRS